MKRFIRFVYILTLVLAGCASNKYLVAESTTENTAEVQKQIEIVQRKIISCMVKANQTKNGKFVNANLIALFVLPSNIISPSKYLRFTILLFSWNSLPNTKS